jgi:3-oxoacyl-[acyl-carrier-protein] synthase III
MSRFFFQVRTDTALIEDPEGIELPHLEAARAEAIAGLRQLAADALLQNLPASNRQVDICDAAGLLLATVSAQDAIRPLLP